MASELWTAQTADGAEIKEGEEIVVTARRGLTLLVKRKEGGQHGTMAT